MILLSIGNDEINRVFRLLVGTCIDIIVLGKSLTLFFKGEYYKFFILVILFLSEYLREIYILIIGDMYLKMYNGIYCLL